MALRTSARRPLNARIAVGEYIALARLYSTLLLCREPFRPATLTRAPAISIITVADVVRDASVPWIVPNSD
jgi:hypothetical protein